MRKEATEKEIENAILEYLSYLPGLFWKNQTTGVYDPTKKIFRKSRNRFHLNGVADILGVMNGQFIAIEVKRPSTRGRISQAQRVFIKRIKECGGIAFVATSVEDVRDILQTR